MTKKSSDSQSQGRAFGGLRAGPSVLKDLIILVLLIVFSVTTSVYFGAREKSAGAQISEAESSGAFSKKVEDFSPTEMPGMVMTIPSGRMVTHPPMTIEKFKQYHEWGEGLVIDVRSRSEYNKGHIPGAISVPAKDFEASYEREAEVLESHLESLIVVYCDSRHCNSGDYAQEYLIKYGFEHVGLFVDGLREWRSAGMKVENALQ